MQDLKLIIVVPCFNEEEVLPETMRRLIELLNQMVQNQLISDCSRIVFVNDGSKDNTWKLISQYAEKHKYVCGINLAGNVGHQNALMAGLEISKERCDAVISIDADLQDDINVIPEMVQQYKDGCDIVYGVRKSRHTDTLFKKYSALGFYKLMNVLGTKVVYNHADFRLLSKRAVCQLCNYRERNLFLRGIVPSIGYTSSVVYYDRGERLAGESKYPLMKMLNFSIDGITSFSVKPVRMVFLMGLVFILISLGILIYVIISVFSGNVVSGWASILLSLWFIGGCLLVGIGVIGEYIGKIYLEVKDRPRYNIEKVIMK